MNLQTFFQSKKFKWLLAGIGALIIALLIFQLGATVGSRKARFEYRWAQNYHRMFGGPKGGFFQDFTGQDFVSGHGTAGDIIKIDGDNLIIQGQDDVEKIITIASSTVIKSGANDLTASALKINDPVVVIGSPQEDGSILAKIIRMFNPEDNLPPPPPRPKKFRMWR
ncbi:hypothetical protein A3G56_02195 [Candidatus Falkowbacteria bacterium RIFCSPLOWO2_12_FULL_45_10]|uniref:DUF5666 domain-containing protein n=3 Tax=Candidatus Falkowiibacteriota TaxID=1752728 RepID=A0A1F5RKG7_9BACT|nr:MAG: hypothetical protein A3D54_01480 [Candidatus Falkowbacteria bacterium RIFCSPHIGHO2_02_FULL_45_15]OGF18578.1 MAG: hypothetical protein A3I35_03985 [Candidatus Falkowbacteria bacterium RIFCSPLOWO2_02_FULL_45_15]OGF18874.1 MAG: hypothetical protein A3G56_02195 [Candidatus Falkowbacteria bacterium RIFCSPLOWO2_12_FULL_45_10]